MEVWFFDDFPFSKKNGWFLGEPAVDVRGGVLMETEETYQFY